MDLRSLMLGLVFALMWSSAFTSARMIVAEASPLAALSVRFLISGLLGVLIARFLGQTMRLTQAQWRATIVFGIFQNAIYLGLNFVAMQTIEASVASIIASSMPLMVALAGWLVFRETLPFLGIVGLVFGVLGVSLIMGLAHRGRGRVARPSFVPYCRDGVNRCHLIRTRGGCGWQCDDDCRVADDRGRRQFGYNRPYLGAISDQSNMAVAGGVYLYHAYPRPCGHFYLV